MLKKPFTPEQLVEALRVVSDSAQRPRRRKIAASSAC